MAMAGLSLLVVSPLLFCCRRFLDGTGCGCGAGLQWFWRALALVVQVVLVVRDLPQKQRSERRHLRLDLGLRVPEEVGFEPPQNPRWFSPLPLEHLLQLKALDRHLPLPLRNRGGESGDLGQARVGRARRDHC